MPRLIRKAPAVTSSQKTSPGETAAHERRRPRTQTSPRPAEEHLLLFPHTVVRKPGPLAPPRSHAPCDAFASANVPQLFRPKTLRIQLSCITDFPNERGKFGIVREHSRKICFGREHFEEGFSSRGSQAKTTGNEKLVSFGARALRAAMHVKRERATLGTGRHRAAPRGSPREARGGHQGATGGLRGGTAHRGGTGGAPGGGTGRGNWGGTIAPSGSQRRRCSQGGKVII